ncbi:unnamed protein product [Caenorhabditis angaria]|uniref:Conserved oligomeric Golgi complex subunit 2 n=1 Tax=Caenorhabditis angaria TaxID=860376 RepID=A0A9P1IRA3_9PELO|nr:unnamed protein product [Caenorhabditis angaria]
MGTQNGTNHHPMFHSSNTFSIDESKLCFNKTHFNRTDFNVERFMNLARQKADLKTIQKDLQLYLKCVQNSMIELINDDYADFVHLSSNLVSLQESLNKITMDIDNIWEEFEDATRSSVGTGERIEKKCEELSINREKQAELRDRIAFLTALEKLGQMLRPPPKQCSALWLQKVSTFVVELNTSNISLYSEEEKDAHNLVLSKLEKVLCDEGVRSASSDCLTLPLVLSILSISDSSHALIANLVADYLYPQIVEKDEIKRDQFEKLQHVFESVLETRTTWTQKIGATHFTPKLRSFLDETLLTFVLTFIDKHMSTVAVPSDTRLFHKCFLATQDFIEKYPSAKFCREMLKTIRDKFNLLVYFKLETHKFTREIENSTNEVEVEAGTSSDFNCKPTHIIFQAIEHIWSDDVYISTIVDKLWDFTLRQILKHFSWAKNSANEKNYKILLKIRLDVEKLQSEVFDFALENIWTKLADIGVDTSLFGQCLTKHGKSVDLLCKEIDGKIVEVFAENLNKEMAQVSDVPKQYRWTKKVAPTSCSNYVKGAVEMIEGFREELESSNHSNIDSMIKSISSTSIQFFAQKAKEVQDSVEATGSSLSRFKKKPASDSGVTDDDKIKIQIFHDAQFLIEKCQEFEITVDGLEAIVERFKETVIKTPVDA